METDNNNNNNNYSIKNINITIYLSSSGRRQTNVTQDINIIIAQISRTFYIFSLLVHGEGLCLL